MRRRTRIALFIAASLVVAGGAAALVISWAIGAREAAAPAEPEFYVPASYREVRQSPGHSAHIGAEDVECVSCHEPADGGIGGVAAPTTCTEGDCHQDLTEAIHAHFLDRDAGVPTEVPTCLGCHRFTQEDDFASKDCIRCHIVPQGTTAAVERHSEASCLLCHSPHDTDQPFAPADCLSCHEQHDSAHGRVESPTGCLVCHKAHPAFELASDRCAGCHSRRGDIQGPVVSEMSATFPGHDACSTCHAQPGGGRLARSCTDCHRDRPVLAEGIVPQHRTCTNCHRPHAARAQATGACNRCHQNVRSDHPRTNQGTCTSCHTAHPQSRALVAQGGAVSCTSCHRVAPSDATAHAGAQACGTCHRPHQFRVQPTSAFCGNCHQTEQSLVAREPGHERCVSCHQRAAHHPRTRVADCGQCHQEERATAPAGHRQCVTCHLPHDGALRARARQCTTCHQEQSRRAVTHSQQTCTNCHRAHGPEGRARPPTCTSCHPTGQLPGLHRVDRHQQCADCHTAHETDPRRGRQSCLSCHEDMTNHQPEARVCTGCHVFRGN